MGRAMLALGLLAVAMFAFGPRARLDPSRPEARPERPPRDLEALEAWVRNKEAGHTRLRPGTEAQIVWHAAPPEPSDWSVVYLHGFSASRQETAPLAERVARALEANRYDARLSGHGLPGEALAQVRGEAWIRDVREAIAIGERIGRQVLVLACSTGASIATLVAALDKPASVAYVFLSPNYGPRDTASSLLLWPWAKHWIPLIVGAERAWEPANEAQAKYWTTRYPIGALFPMMAAVDAVRKQDLSTIRAPFQIFVSDDDPVVDPASTREVVRSMVAARREIVSVVGPGDDHVLAGDILSPARTSSIASRIVAWAEALEL